MAIFPRRALQRLIDGSPGFLTASQVSKFVTDLNGEPKIMIPWEWELALLSALSRLGAVRYEPRLGRRTPPDILFSLPPPSSGSFVAEITTVSDKSAHNENPIDELSAEIFRLAKKSGISPGCFSVRVGSARLAVSGGIKVRLKLPQRGQFSSMVFARDFRSFLREIRASPDRRRVFRVWTDKVEVMIHYTPGKRYFSMVHPGYDSPRSVTQNRVFAALREKARQLRQSRQPGPFGIFICDGDCDALRMSLGALGVMPERIIEEFLRRYRSISFVQVFVVSRTFGKGHGIWGLAVRSKIFKGQGFDALPGGLRSMLGRLDSYFPEPETDPLSARLTLIRRLSKTGHSFRGGCAITDRQIKFSARVLLEYLAGRIDHREFLAQAGLFSRTSRVETFNFFKQALLSGRLIAELSIERCPDKDDDWAVITFSEPDPAVSRFRPPSK